MNKIYLWCPIKGQKSKKQNKPTQTLQRYWMTRHGWWPTMFVPPSHPWSNQVAGNQCNAASKDMNDSGTSKIMIAIGCQPTNFGFPSPVGNKGVHPAYDSNAVGEVGMYMRTFCNASGDNGCTGWSESVVKKPFSIFSLVVFDPNAEKTTCTNPWIVSGTLSNAVKLSIWIFVPKIYLQVRYHIQWPSKQWKPPNNPSCFSWWCWWRFWTLHNPLPKRQIRIALGRPKCSCWSSKRSWCSLWVPPGWSYHYDPTPFLIFLPLPNPNPNEDVLNLSHFSLFRISCCFPDRYAEYIIFRNV